MEQTHTPGLIREAIKLCGGKQTDLAKQIGCTQQFVSLLLKGGRMSVETALRIEGATDGKIPASKLRPDFFKPKRKAQ